jgi:NADH pyrophosphatase NudC (nudix superfamily)
MPQYKYCPCCAAPLVDYAVQNEVRRACSAKCGFIHYDNPTPVVAAVVEHNGMVVLAHNRAWPATLKSFYGLITGFLERAESPEQCALREVKEELNLDGTSATLIGAYGVRTDESSHRCLPCPSPGHGDAQRGVG